ncbi:prepilin peptidase [Patescibacteria group bacterium]|nr:MAG: prepilin peptidase [Patescibacteria group bacterium]
METLVGILFFVFGAIVGSFLNVVALRYNTGRKPTGRSACFSCGKKLEVYELIPIFSYIFLRGRCSQCKSSISIQYPLVEFTTGLLFVLMYWYQSQSLILLTYYLLVSCLLVVIIVYDIRHMIIPDGLVYAFIGLGFLRLLYETPLASLIRSPEIWNLLAGPILFLPFWVLWYFSKGAWMGFGDAKLAWGIGWTLGLVKGASAIILGFWIGAVLSLLVIVLGKLASTSSMRKMFGSLGLPTLHLKSEIPFAPYLIVGMFVALFTGADFLGLGLILFS